MWQILRWVNVFRLVNSLNKKHPSSVISKPFSLKNSQNSSLKKWTWVHIFSFDFFFLTFIRHIREYLLFEYLVTSYFEMEFYLHKISLKFKPIFAPVDIWYFLSSYWNDVFLTVLSVAIGYILVWSETFHVKLLFSSLVVCSCLARMWVAVCCKY